jgi:hypothetical protein
MAAGNEDDFGGLKYYAMQTGFVSDRADPEGFARVKVVIPGLCDQPSTGWAWPMGSLGGGSAQRGSKSVPQVGAEVCVFFKGGDTDSPYYIPANWGAPGGVSELPGATTQNALGTSNADPDVHVIFESSRYILYVDERPASPGLYITDKVSGDSIYFDGSSTTGPGIGITATAAVYFNIYGAFIVDASKAQINGRNVSDGPQSI